MSQRTVEALIKSDHDMLNAVEKRRIINMFDYDNFKSKLEYKEEVRMRKELSATSIYWDAKGKLKVEIISPCGVIRSELLCDLRKLETKTILYKPMDTVGLEKPIYVVSYHAKDAAATAVLTAAAGSGIATLKRLRYGYKIETINNEYVVLRRR